jgi:hypothetical protein
MWPLSIQPLSKWPKPSTLVPSTKFPLRKYIGLETVRLSSIQGSDCILSSISRVQYYRSWCLKMFKSHRIWKYVRTQYSEEAEREGDTTLFHHTFSSHFFIILFHHTFSWGRTTLFQHTNIHIIVFALNFEFPLRVCFTQHTRHEFKCHSDTWIPKGLLHFMKSACFWLKY